MVLEGVLDFLKNRTVSDVITGSCPVATRPIMLKFGVPAPGNALQVVKTFLNDSTISDAINGSFPCVSL